MYCSLIFLQSQSLLLIWKCWHKRCRTQWHQRSWSRPTLSNRFLCRFQQHVEGKTPLGTCQHMDARLTHTTQHKQYFTQSMLLQQIKQELHDKLNVWCLDWHYTRHELNEQTSRFRRPRSRKKVLALWRCLFSSQFEMSCWNGACCSCALVIKHRDSGKTTFFVGEVLCFPKGITRGF